MIKLRFPLQLGYIVMGIFVILSEGILQPSQTRNVPANTMFTPVQQSKGCSNCGGEFGAITTVAYSVRDPSWLLPYTYHTVYYYTNYDWPHALNGASSAQ